MEIVSPTHHQEEAADQHEHQDSPQRVYCGHVEEHELHRYEHERDHPHPLGNCTFTDEPEDEHRRSLEAEPQTGEGGAVFQRGELSHRQREQPEVCGRQIDASRSALFEVYPSGLSQGVISLHPRTQQTSPDPRSRSKHRNVEQEKESVLTKPSSLSFERRQEEEPDHDHPDMPEPDEDRGIPPQTECVGARRLEENHGIERRWIVGELATREKE